MSGSFFVLVNRSPWHAADSWALACCCIITKALNCILAVGFLITFSIGSKISCGRDSSMSCGMVISRTLPSSVFCFSTTSVGLSTFPSLSSVIPPSSLKYLYLELLINVFNLSQCLWWHWCLELFPILPMFPKRHQQVLFCQQVTLSKTSDTVCVAGPWCCLCKIFPPPFCVAFIFCQVSSRSTIPGASMRCFNCSTRRAQECWLCLEVWHGCPRLTLVTCGINTLYQLFYHHGMIWLSSYVCVRLFLYLSDGAVCIAVYVCVCV